MQRSWPCLPASPTASRTFCAAKVTLIVLLAAALVADVVYTSYVMSQFKVRVNNAKTRSEIQVRSKLRNVTFLRQVC